MARERNRHAADRYRFADLIAPRRRPAAHFAPLHRVDHPVTQVLRIRLRHSCWPPPSQQVESKSPRFGNLQLNLQLDSSQTQPALVRESPGAPAAMVSVLLCLSFGPCEGWLVPGGFRGARVPAAAAVRRSRPPRGAPRGTARYATDARTRTSRLQGPSTSGLQSFRSYVIAVPPTGEGASTPQH